MEENMTKKSSIPCKSRTFKPEIRNNYGTIGLRATPRKKFWVR